MKILKYKAHWLSNDLEEKEKGLKDNTTAVHKAIMTAIEQRLYETTGKQ